MPGKTIEEEMTPRMFDYAIAELCERARTFYKHPKGAVKVFECAVYKSDFAAAEKVKAVQAAVKALEDVPQHLKDWLPGSDETARFVVNPYLFPVVFGKTRILPVGSQPTTLEDAIARTNEGEVLKVPKDKKLPYCTPPNDLDGEAIQLYSTKFQWLPFEVDISDKQSK